MLTPNGIRAIFFDLDGTLRHNVPPPEKIILDLAINLGAPDLPENRRRTLRWVHYYWAQSAELLRDAEAYKDSEEDFRANYFRHVLVAYGCPAELLEQIHPQIYVYMDEQYQPQDELKPGVLDTLDELKTAGFGLAVISNRTKPYPDILQKLELESFFELVLAAGEIEAWKPEPEIFFHALQKMDLKAEETIYVGDNYYTDVVGARRAGLFPVLLDPDGIFTDPGCSVLNSMPELINLLEKHQPYSSGNASPNN